MAPSGEGNDRQPRLGGQSQQGKAEVGVPTFEHDQYTFEGEIERLGAFASGAARATGAKRVIAIALVVIFVGPALVALVIQIVKLITG